jgi:hypothetical protein
MMFPAPAFLHIYQAMALSWEGDHHNQLVANKANSELLDFELDAGFWQGLENDHECWAKQLMHGCQLADPDTDWETHMLQLKAIDSPQGVARLVKQKFALAYKCSTATPQTLSAHAANAAPTASGCTNLMIVD